MVSSSPVRNENCSKSSGFKKNCRPPLVTRIRTGSSAEDGHHALWPRIKATIEPSKFLEPFIANGHHSFRNHYKTLRRCLTSVGNWLNEIQPVGRSRKVA